MPDHLTPAQRHLNMSRIRSADTKAEVVLRKALWRRGFRYRKNDRRLPGSPDIVLPKYRAVIFVNGCFWHGHKGCRYFRLPETNRGFWAEKIRRNRERDQRCWRALEAKGWMVITVWSCELGKNELARTVDKIISELGVRAEELKARAVERREILESYRVLRRAQREKYQLLADENN